MSSVIRRFFIAILLFNMVACQQVSANSGNIDYPYLLEEEKLARDVYVTLGNKWDLQIFINIQESEARHIEMVKNILVNNGQQVELYAETGKFKNQDVQKLYDSLISKGLKSVKDALEVGLSIEEMDIADLEYLIKDSKNPSDTEMLNYLLSASMRHKSAFNRNIEKY